MKNAAISMLNDRLREYAEKPESPFLQASAGDGQTGTARTDGNRYSITLTDNQESFPPLIPDSVMETVTIVQATN